jgi:alkanesulfonate monooxygenase SsuD/methylene tetrahydromethanopterin reductase-like flavin-dependent oxidoreductase (luciferase family)
VAPQFRNPPGFISVADNARLLQGRTPPRSFTKDGRVITMATASVQELIDAAIMFCGTPDQVTAQIADFVAHTGGLGNLLMMGQAGFLSHDDTVDSLSLFAREVLPRLKEMKQPAAAAIAAA